MTDPTLDPNLALLPEGDTFDADINAGTDSISDEELNVNFSHEEATAESFKPLAPGRYRAVISKVDIGRSKSEKNPNKPYYKMVYTINEGPAKGRKLFDNVMLFPGALYSISQLMKALGFPVSGGTVQIPRPTELLDRELILRVVREPAKTVDGKSYDERNSVKGYFPVQSMASAGVPGADPLAP